jgi:hypothetical protein
MPGASHFVVLTLLMLLVPLLTAVVLVRERLASPAVTLVNRVAVLCNLVLLGASGWEAVAQYPYPEGNSVIPFALLAVCTPILSLMALLGGGKTAMRRERRTAAGGE